MPDYTLKIRRYDPESGEPAYWQDSVSYTHLTLPTTPYV